VIDGYEAAFEANGKQDGRHRIEHIDTIQRDDISRLADLDIIASMQPVHPPGSAGLPLQPTLSLMGPDRWATAFAWKALADKDIPIAFGTDWPVSPLNPLYAIRCALTRQPWEDHLPDQRLTLDQCLTNYTRTGAYAAFDEEKMGQIVEGMLADLVLIKGDLTTLADQEAPLPEVILTVCDGEITYEAPQQLKAEIA
jgi:predicted amidohydrolase YtcJ